MLLILWQIDGMKDLIVQWIRNFYEKNDGLNQSFNAVAYEEQAVYWAIGMFALLIVLSVIVWYFSRIILHRLLFLLVDRSKSSIDYHLLKNKVFRALAHLVPLMFMDYFLSIVLYQFPATHGSVSKIVMLLIIFTIMITLNRALNAIRDIVMENEIYSDKPIQSYFQVAKIISTGIFLVLMLSTLTNKSPIFFLTSIGAVSAIVILIFKDTILGFVGSIQLSANDMIRIGDWVTMEKYGADGVVEEINLATVKVRNFDKTITTIPTYSFISDSFVNWRGMKDSDGRQIKRAVNIQINSIQFATDELMERLRKIRILKEFIEEREAEILAYNKLHGYLGEDAINARRQTNIGLYRRYIEYYLKQNKQVNSSMNLMVRQLNSSEKGVPIEVYCFTHTKVWYEYEEVMANIFDHIFSITPLFDLAIFESPTGRDLKSLVVSSDSSVN